MSNTVTYKQKVSISFSPVRENFEGVLSDVYKVFVVKAVPAVPQIAGPRKKSVPIAKSQALNRRCAKRMQSKSQKENGNAC